MKIHIVRHVCHVPISIREPFRATVETETKTGKIKEPVRTYAKTKTSSRKEARAKGRSLILGTACIHMRMRAVFSFSETILNVQAHSLGPASPLAGFPTATGKPVAVGKHCSSLPVPFRLNHFFFSNHHFQ